MKNLRLKSSRVVWIAAVAVIAVLVVAWIDGGEEPLRRISQPVTLPGVGA
ncbi:hypothetical protein [Erythrobacter litoralis]|nr:hypothetical protein [Erythrobacter litoralis]